VEAALANRDAVKPSMAAAGKTSVFFTPRFASADAARVQIRVAVHIGRQGATYDEGE
jgi:hypothetical protein